MLIYINPTIITKPLRDIKTKQYKKYKEILVWCFVQDILKNNNRQTISKSEPIWELLHVYTDHIEIKKKDGYYNLKTTKKLPIPKNILEILKWVREVEDGERKYIARVVR